MPRDTGGRALLSVRLFVRDHRMREVPATEQALEAYYEDFVFSQSRPGAEAARASVQRSYGSDPTATEVSGREARAYPRGPEPPPDDPDPRMPAVVVWAEGDDFFLLASDLLEVEDLLPIARSVR